VRLDHGITLPVAPHLLTLPEIATFRFVAPDSLALGLTAEDATSVGLREPRELREAVGTVLLGLGWEVMPDSAAFELALFMTARTVRRTEQRTESYPDPNATLPRCGYTREDRPGVNCTKDPNPVRTVNVRSSMSSGASCWCCAAAWTARTIGGAIPPRISRE
jgi:hypothetical protein